MFRTDPHRRSTALAFFLLTFVAGAGLAAPWCDRTSDLELSTTPRSFDTSQTTALRWQVPATGVLTVELTPDGGHPVAIDVIRCAFGEPPADVLIVERSVTRLVLASRTAGALYLRVATPASAFVVATRFARARLVVEDVELDGLPVRQTSFFASVRMTKGEPEEIDPDPDGLVVSRCATESWYDFTR